MGCSNIQSGQDVPDEKTREDAIRLGGVGTCEIHGGGRAASGPYGAETTYNYLQCKGICYLHEKRVFD